MAAKTESKGRKRAVVPRKKRTEDFYQLSLKEMKFVFEYIKADGNGTLACINAGYPPKSAGAAASNLLRKRAVRIAIEEERREIRRRSGLSIDAVISGLWDQADYYGTDASHAARVKAWESLGEIIGAIPDKTLIRLNGNINHRHAHLHASVNSADNSGVKATDLPIEIQRQILEHYRERIAESNQLTIVQGDAHEQQEKVVDIQDGQLPG